LERKVLTELSLKKVFTLMIFLLFSRLLVILQLNMFTIIQKELRQFFSGFVGLPDDWRFFIDHRYPAFHHP